MQINRTGSAQWSGGIKDGKGQISTQSGFTMALSLILGEAGFTATSMETTAKVTLESVEGGFAISAILLTLRGTVPNCDEKTFIELAGKAKAGCPVSKALAAVPITLDAQLA
jgi:osmotically inducible protein OsmC